MKPVEVYAPGTLLRLNDVRCVVQAVEIVRSGVSRYLVAWWDDRVRQEEWVAPHELERLDAEEPRSLSVNFVAD